MSNPKHDKGEHYLTTPKAEPFLERLIFNNRALILIAFAVLTLFLGYNAIKIQPSDLVGCGTAALLVCFLWLLCLTCSSRHQTFA